MPSAELTRSAIGAAHRTRRFAVAWRNTSLGLIAPVGVLDHDSLGYRFEYLRNVDQVPDFRPFLGFPNLDWAYESQRLWPFFDLRVMDPKRPDYESYVARLGLPPTASRLDVLSRSGGEQKGDSVYLAEEPQISEDGATEATFLVRGVSYAIREYSSAGSASQLRSGDQLTIESDPDNPVNAQAMLLVTRTGARVGWVPDLLIPYAHAVGSGGSAEVTVVQNNGPNSPWHLRLLVRLAGQVSPGLPIFTGEDWPPLRLVPGV
ncbi:MAG: hypothetical protein QOE23_3521 [Pseudonocardiales bacterium]|jgi:hypothetical protein|nr:hypothetical protein [Pseudonocardiales bacterium]